MDWNTIFLYLGLVVVYAFSLQALITNVFSFVIRLPTLFFGYVRPHYSFFLCSFITLNIINLIWKKISGHHLPFFAVLFMIMFLCTRDYLNRNEQTYDQHLKISAEISSIVIYALYLFIFVEFNWV